MTEKQWGRRGKDYEKGIHITTVMIPRCPVPVPLIIPHAVHRAGFLFIIFQAVKLCSFYYSLVLPVDSQ
jgi:hypothetical protein